MKDSVSAHFKSTKSEIMAWRHELHRHPELAFEEHWTSDFIAARLEEFGYRPHRGIGKTGIVATLENGPGPSIGLRADMDALPITEQTNLAFSSQNPGRMHACGHDGHVSMLLAAAQYLAESRCFRGTVHFIFQPAEENEAGADAMIRAGLFETYDIQQVYGLHNWPGLDTGKFAARPGPQMAAFDTFEILLKGQGTHAAMPHSGQDLLLAAAQIQTQMQSIVARNVDPLETAVVSVTQIHGGDTWNALPSNVVMRGCTRHFSASVQALIERRMEAICSGVAQGFGIEVDLDCERRYPATVNSPAETQLALNAAADVVGKTRTEDEFQPSMASEDFAYFLAQKPGCYIWLGSGSTEGGNMLHSPFYQFNDDILVHGAAWWVRIAQRASGYLRDC
jgi:amidohydrolase